MTRTTTTDILVTKLTIDGKEYTVGTKKAGSDIDKLERKTEGSLANLKKHWVAYAAGITSVLVISKKLLSLYAVQERAEIRLAFAVKASGQNVAVTTRHLTEYAASLQRATIHGDEAIISIQTMLIQLGELSGTELDRATRLTLDFASAMGIDMKAAGILMAKAATGSTEALSRYGIVLDTSIPKSEKFTELLRVMQEKFGGTAEAETDTLFGSTHQFKNALGDLGESMGEVAAGPMTAFLKTLTDIVNTFNTPIPEGSMGALLFQPGRQVGIFSGLEGGGLDFAQEADRPSPPTPPTDFGFKGAQVSELSAFLATQQAETTALLETQQAMLDARAEMETVSQEERIAAIAQAYDIEQQMAIAHGEALISVQQKEAAHAKMIADLKGQLALQGVKIGLNLFASGKQLAIGNAIIATYQGAAQAMRDVPYPFNLAAAAVVVSAGLAQVKQIKSASASGGGGGATITTSTATPAAQPVTAPGQDINLSIVGAGELVDKEALGQLFFDSLGDLLTATGGRAGNITIDFTEN